MRKTRKGQCRIKDRGRVNNEMIRKKGRINRRGNHRRNAGKLNSEQFLNKIKAVGKE